MSHNHSKSLYHRWKRQRYLSRSLVQALVKYEKITTTLTNAKALRSIIEPLITLGKKSQYSAQPLAQKRLIMARLEGDMVTTSKICDDLSVRYNSRPGGYTRVIRTHRRPSDNSPMAIIMLV